MTAVVAGPGDAGARPERLHHLLLRAAARRPAAPAVGDAGGVWTYRELADAALSTAAWLTRSGVTPGDRVAVHDRGGRRFAAVLFGCAAAGATLVPLSPDLRPFQLAPLLADAGPALVLTGTALPEGDLPGGLTSAAVHPLDGLPGPPADSSAGAPSGPPAGPPGPDCAPALLLYTSGTTAVPKAVVCPHEQVLFATRAIARRVVYRPDDVVLCRLPWSFDYGLYQLLLCVLATATVVVADSRHDSGLLAEIRRAGATVVPIVPALGTMLTRLATRDRRPTAVRLFTNTGEALSAATAAGLRQRFPGARVQLMYGTTECKRISVLEPDGDRIRPGSVGRPLDGTRVAIRGPGGRRLPPGRRGEIVVAGPHVMAGYWRAPALTARTFVPDRDTGEVWLRTGDQGWLDSAGHLYLVGRLDHRYKQRGTRVSAAEVEAAARDIDGVDDAAVAVPAAGRGAVLWVAATLTGDEVLRRMRERLEPAKVPPVCHVLDRLPRTGNGKVDRRALATLIDIAAENPGCYNSAHPSDGGR
jgi:acyl-CoA synthetase (AMP-forming)/AMP-acid ligase II